MKPLNFRAILLVKIFIPSIFFLTACNEELIPADLPGTYTGKERVIIRYDRGGQYIYREKEVLVSLIIDSKGNVIGMVGEATYEECNVIRNRGWIARQLNIKTDFLIEGMLNGNIFESDTIVNKNISIPFNIQNGELKGSLVQTTKGESFPIISILKMQKR